MRYPKGFVLPSRVHKKLKNHIEIELCDHKNNVVAIAKVDKKDWPLVQKYRWHRKWSAWKNTQYVESWNGGNKIRLHQFIMGRPNIDHINRDGLDNRRKNLRFADNTLQNINKLKQSNNTSGYRGVYFHPKFVAGKEYPYWEAQISLKSKVIFLGCFLKKEDAIKARKKAEVKYFKDYANTL